MTKEKKILYGVAIIVLIAGAFLLGRIFTKNKMPESENMRVIKVQDQMIEQLIESKQQLFELAKSGDRKDSLLAIQFQNNQPKYIINERSLQNIPTVYRDISKEQLRKRATEY